MAGIRLAVLALALGAACAAPLQACEGGCLGPKLDPAAVASAPVYIETTFSAPFLNFAAVASTYQLAFGICYAIGCNYRNVTLALATADFVLKEDAVYLVLFYALPGSESLTAFPAALYAALPSTSPTTVGTVAYGMSSTQGGAIPTLTGVFPVPSRNAPLPPAAYPPPARPPLPTPCAPFATTGGQPVECELELYPGYTYVIFTSCDSVKGVRSSAALLAYFRASSCAPFHSLPSCWFAPALSHSPAGSLTRTPA